MWYVYEKDGRFVASKEKPDVAYATVKRMPPRRGGDGYWHKLNADVASNRVWWDAFPCTEAVYPDPATDDNS